MTTNVTSKLAKDSPESRPAIIHFSTTPLYRLEESPEKYAQLLKKKDLPHIGPIVKYLIRNSGITAYLGGEAVRNLCFNGKRKYKRLNILAIVPDQDLRKYSAVMDNIISANDGAFSLVLKYRVRKNRSQGCFENLAVARYLIEPRLEGPEKVLYLFRASTIELDLSTRKSFSAAFGFEPE